LRVNRVLDAADIALPRLALAALRRRNEHAYTISGRIAPRTLC